MQNLGNMVDNLDICWKVFLKFLSEIAGLYAALLSFGTVVDNKIHLEYVILCQLLLTNEELRPADNPEKL